MTREIAVVIKVDDSVEDDTDAEVLERILELGDLTVVDGYYILDEH